MKKLRHEEILHHAEEDWEDPEQREDPKNIEPDLPFSMQTRQSVPERPAKKYNPYRYDLIAYRMDLKKVAKNLVCLEEVTAPQEAFIVDDQEKE